METFKKLTIEDRDILLQYLSMQKHSACDYDVGNLILWADVYHTHYAIAHEMLFIKFQKGEEINFAFPMGKGNLKEAFGWLFAYCKEQDIPFKMNLVERDMFEEIENNFPGKFGITYVRDSADYVYHMENLKNLVGKKYHGKKNHINKFLKINIDWKYECISDENTQECIEMVKEWCVQNSCCADKSKVAEVCVLIKGLQNRERLHMIGGVIRTNGRITAVTMGEKSNDTTFTIHFEKAYANVQGAYPMINQQFIIHELSAYAYVNREEDMGIEGLRKAKESYYPAFMTEKGILFQK